MNSPKVDVTTFGEYWFGGFRFLNSLLLGMRMNHGTASLVLRRSHSSLNLDTHIFLVKCLICCLFFTAIVTVLFVLARQNSMAGAA